MTARLPQSDCAPTAIARQLSCGKTAPSLHASNERASDFHAALQQLTVGRKAKRLRELWPAIEARLAEGISHGQILAILNESGLQLTERTYKSYLYRFRKRRRTAENGHELSRMPGTTQPQIADDVPAIQAFASEAKSARRPPTFDFDPSGILPELLK